MMASQTNGSNGTTSPTFRVGEKAVHPSHGVGEVMELEQRELGGRNATIYVLRIMDTGLKVMVPMEAAERGAPAASPRS